MAHPNENLVREGFAAFQKGDLDTLRTRSSPTTSATTFPAGAHRW